MTSTDQKNLQKKNQQEPVYGAFKIRVSDDQLAVYLSDLSLIDDDGEAITVDMVMDELKSQKITTGIDRDKISAILCSTTTTILDEELCIARGVLPVEGKDDEFTWNFPERYLRQDCAVVFADEIIATHIEANKGTSGMTVYGKTISVNPGTKRLLNIGAGIQTIKTETGEEYRSTKLGIVTTEQDHSEFIQVDNLFQVTDDGMEARMDIYVRSACGQIITYENILTELSNNGIVHGINQNLIQSSLKQALYLSSNKPIGCIEQVIVAHGVEPQQGKDASLIISREENVIGAELSHGFIDFHELGYPWNVNEGDRVGYLLEARAGTEGMTIHGSSIKVNKPKDIKCKFAGLHKDDSGRLFTDLDGALIINGTSLAVVDLLVINGDIGPKSGNIHSKIPVHVKGHVKSGYILESEKEVIIDHNIEDAIVRAGSSILIKGGIRGIKSRVYSPSDVSVNFVENASIYVNGNLRVNGSIMNSIVASNDTVIVGNKKVKHSMVVGGELIVNKYLEVTELGSDAYFKTIVRLGIAQEERREIILLDKAMDEIKKNLQDIEQIEYRHRLTPKDDTKEVLHKVAITRQSLLEQNLLLEEKKNSILEQLKQTSSARAVIKKCVYPGVIVFINDRYLKVHNKLGMGSFVFDKDNDSVIFVADS